MRECKRGLRVGVDGDKKMEGTAEMAEDVCAKAQRAEKGRRGGWRRGRRLPD